jgi:hypothetical protein
MLYTVLFHDTDDTQSLVIGTFENERLAEQAAHHFVEWYYPGLDTIWNPGHGLVSWKNHKTGKEGRDELVVLSGELNKARIGEVV